MPAAHLPDDIEQMLLDGERLRATHALVERRGMALDDARALVGQWLSERRQAHAGAVEIEATGIGDYGALAALRRLLTLARGDTGQSRLWRTSSWHGGMPRAAGAET